MADHNLSSRTLRRIAKEVNGLRTQPPEAIRLVVNEDDLTHLKAWIQGPAETPYQNGYFQISIRFDSEYPSVPPTCIFITKIFHPNVGPKGEICVNTLKKDWTSNTTLTEILMVVKCLLIYPNPESALDEEAGKLLLENYQEYSSRARLWTEIHAKNRPNGLFDDSPSAEQPPSATTDAKPLPLPFTSSTQENHSHQIKLSATGSSGDDELMKSNGILPASCTPHLLMTSPPHSLEAENLHPPTSLSVPTTNKPTPNPVPALAHKDKERRGRKRL